uniref:Uncharacterized protein AlNc14C26G2565 n=1 Tax=Albugo laibachii Nc14 TaxID=890382 RepID=F0W6S9_9STRA|nr:conserved hypothetical protein [Albugo laibachii Nc14]|eukprot:CCA16824.1 conserved hypothetical protein [Albugo laibachii Nc14]
MIDAMELLSILGPVVCCEQNLAICLPHERIIHSIGSILRPGPNAQAEDDSMQVEELLSARQDPLGYRSGINMRMENTSDSFRELERMERESDVLIIDVTLEQERLNGAVMSRKLIEIAEKLASKRIHIVSVTSLNLELFKYGSNEESVDLCKMLKHRFLYGEECVNGSGRSRKRYFGAMYQQLHYSSPKTLRTSSLELEHQILASTIAQLHSEISVPIFVSFSCDSNQTVDFSAYVQSFFYQLQKQGAKMDKIIFCHADRWVELPHDDYEAFLFSLADLGVCLLLSSIGIYTASGYLLVNPLLTLGEDSTSHSDSLQQTPPRDPKIVQFLHRLLAQGYANQVLLSSSVLLKTQLRRYGGGGYQYLEQFFKQQFLARGFDAQELENWWQQMTRTNPLRLLSWYIAPCKADTPREYLICSICKQSFEPIVGEFFTKFSFTYCGTKCLKIHSKRRFEDVK